MADNISGQLTVDAFGRPSFLGQLYNARTSQLLSYPLFPADVIASVTKTDSKGFTDNEYEEYRDSKDRAKLLNISASVSLTLLGGGITVEGAAAFVDRSNSTSSSVAITGMETRWTHSLRLPPNDRELQSSVLMTETMKKSGATHVVTEIIYGATMLGTLTETNNSLIESSNTDGRLKIEMLKAAKAFMGAKGEAEVKIEERNRIDQHELEMRLLGDYLDPDPDVKIPTTPAALSEKLYYAGSLLVVSVPIKILLTPIGFFDHFSAEAFYRELQEAEITEIMTLFDDLQTLSQEADLQLATVRRTHGSHFPGLIQSCQKVTVDLSQLVTKFRGELGKFLREFRSGNPTASEDDAPMGFLQIWRLLFYGALGDHELNVKLIPKLDIVRKFANDSRFPLAKINEISALMTLEPLKSIVVVIVPEDARLVELQNFGEGLYGSISLLGKDKIGDILCHSIYADSLLREELVQLDGPSGAVLEAYDRSRSEKLPCIVSYGVSATDGEPLDWKGDVGPSAWGFKFLSEDMARYTGDLRDGKPHGYGIKRYVGNEAHVGTWFYGNRDGSGKRVRILGEQGDQAAELETGVWVDDRWEEFGIVVDVVVYQRNMADTENVVDSDTVALVSHPFLPPANPTIEEVNRYIPAQIRKLNRVFTNWEKAGGVWMNTTWQSTHVWEDTSQLEPARRAQPFQNYHQIYRSNVHVRSGGTPQLATGSSVVDLTPELLADNPWLLGYVYIDGVGDDGKFQKNKRVDIRNTGERIVLEAHI